MVALDQAGLRERVGQKVGTGGGERWPPTVTPPLKGALSSGFAAYEPCDLNHRRGDLRDHRDPQFRRPKTALPAKRHHESSRALPVTVTRVRPRRGHGTP